MRKQTGFTLVELLCVVATIAVLAALLLPAVQAARGSAARTDCRNRLRQIGVGLLLHHDTWKEFPPGNVVKEEGICRAWGLAGRDYPSQDGANWALHLLPYLEENELYARYDFNTFNEAEANGTVVGTSVGVYVCPADIEPLVPLPPANGPACGAALNIAYMPGSYRGVSGSSDGIYFLDSSELSNYKPARRGVLHAVGVRGFGPESLRTIADGASYTLAVGESTTRTRLPYRTFWAYSYSHYSLSAVTRQARTLLGDYETCEREGGPGGAWPCQRGWGSFHPGVIQFVACDGAVRSFGADVDLELLESLATIAGGERPL